MGSGAPRNDVQQKVEGRPLSGEVNQALAKALRVMDEHHPSFKDNRKEEKDSQLTKMWNRKCREIDDYLRAIAKVMIDSHQLSLDMGSDGGGRGTRPWLEETNQAFDKLYIKLDNEEVVAVTGDTELLRGPVGRLSYDWVEEAVVNWVLTGVELRTGQGA